MKTRLSQTVCLLAVLSAAVPASAQPPASEPPAAPQPTDAWDALDETLFPPIFQTRAVTPETIELRARMRQHTLEIRRLRHEHFGRRLPEMRAAGLARLREITDPAAFPAMIAELRREEDDVRLGVLDHLARQGDAGQGALALAAIYEPDAAIRNEATQRMVSPAPPPVLGVLDAALRSPDDTIANNAGSLAGALNVLEAIPLLIYAQAGAPPDRPERRGDLAWIAVQTQTAYVRALQAAAGDASAAFVPIVGVLTEGFVFRVVDAVVIIYRTIVHRVLVAMTTSDWGQSTAELGYDRRAWLAWYNQQYVPYKNEQALIAEMAREPEPAPPSPPDDRGGS